MDTPSKTLFATEFRPVAPAPPLDAVEPLPCDRWLAASALQKAIRRGDALTAGRAVRTLYRYEPRSAWRRLLVIAYEDIGIGALDAVVTTTVRGANAKARREAGGDEASALATSQMLAAAPKDRSPTSCSPLCCITQPLRARDRGSDRSRSIGGSNGSRIRPYRAASARSPLGILPGSRNGENPASVPATLPA